MSGNLDKVIFLVWGNSCNKILILIYSEFLLFRSTESINYDFTITDIDATKLIKQRQG